MAAFLKLDGIRGLARATGHEGWIELLSLQMKVQPRRASDDPKLPPGPIDFVCSHRVDGSSSALFHAVQFPEPVEGQVDFVGPTGIFLGIDMVDVVVTSYQLSSSGNPASREGNTASFTLNMPKISYTTQPRNGGVGDLPAGFDLSGLALGSVL